MTADLSYLLVEIEGVLVDTRAARRDALAAALRTASVALPEAALHAAARASTSSQAVEAARAWLDASEAPRRLDATDVELATLRAERALEAAAAQGVALVPGAREALAALASRARLAVVTRAPRAMADAILARAELEAVVGFVVTAAPGEPVRPDAYRRALVRLALGTAPDPATAAAIVDTPAGADAARAAGLRVVLVDDGAGDATSDTTRPDARVATVGALTYDALMQLLVPTGARAQ